MLLQVPRRPSQIDGSLDLVGQQRFTRRDIGLMKQTPGDPIIRRHVGQGIQPPAPPASHGAGKPQETPAYGGRSRVEAGQHVNHAMRGIRREELIPSEPAERHRDLAPGHPGHEVCLDQ